ncbi:MULTISPECIES: hypothetical protein [Paenibacillus]|uniref:Cellobiose phosphorylase n=1 Tax=Paenibacillus apis TaxID=1792174 RepID=A0A919Y309_9BACL|nr:MULTISPECIES: hypothetical protein [Paenibacillus]GIO42398.1 hypothetical protein J41TS4_21560 [Paenibacillus apis]
MEEAYYNCMRLKNRKVRIMTRDMKHYTGTIVDVDYNNVYLRPERGGPVQTSAFYPGPYGPGWYGNDILTLSLFTLLAIALI